jgi:hypothetical protein
MQVDGCASIARGLLCMLLALAPAVDTHGATVDAQKPVKVKIEGQDVYALGFDRLAAFEYELVDAATGATEEEIEASRKRDQIPAWIRLYDKQRIALTGYMLPLQVQDGLTTKLIMMRDITTCCFGNVPNMNEFVIVTMKSGGIKAIQDVPVVLTGVFKIAEQYEGGYLTSIFQLEGEKFLGPKK